MTWNNAFVLGLFGLSAGLITSCGYFSLFMTVGVINRFVQFTHTADRERLYENIVISGVITGNLITLINVMHFIPSFIWMVFSVFAGMFSGCFLLSLSEAVKGVPVFVRRARLRTGFVIIISCLAFGKGLGALFYFLNY